ncbi:MAG: exodeoxyribonuclease VII large subunit [Nitrospirae bacterium]|nr:exodeoxyribonuclease VII large subunit [Nitrospirota bacterium]
MPRTFSLYELNQVIRAVMENAFPQTFLVTAEIASIDIRNHCYLTLIDKDEDVIRAEIKAVIWADKYKRLSSQFRDATGTDLRKGIKILFEAYVNFHERYGLKLNIIDIDPSYTIGELAVKRKEILERLQKEGLKDRNKILEFPFVPQRIGIISSATAAGYEDLMTHLMKNPYDYKFTCTLYEALMQGDNAEMSIVKALKKCAEDSACLDVLVIVRGGGGQADLLCFDSYEIARAIAFLPIPVISGIGHERDVTVVDEVSHSRAKTPTAVADLIINKVKDFEDRVDSSAHGLIHGVNKLASDHKKTLTLLAKNVEGSVRKELIGNDHRFYVFIKGLRYALKFIQNERERLRSRENSVAHLDPGNVLKRGYSITYNNGRAVKSVSEVQKGDALSTVLHKGEIISRVENKTNVKR